jgi:pre-mRNA-splicing factor SYF2/beta-D-xylosidase 4
MESTTENGVHHWRNEFDATVTQQDLVDSYLAPFQACVEKGDVTSLMCSYNAINGVPSCANDWLLDTVARKEWGFDGYITSDCDADADVFNNHHYTATAEETVRDVLRAGTDVDCGGFVQQHAQSALDKKLIDEADIDKRLSYLFRMRMRLAHFDATPLDSIKTNVVCSDYAKALSMDGARQGTTLMKNTGILPLTASSVKTAAVIGPLGDDSIAHSMAGYYGDTAVCDGKFYSITDAIQQYTSNVTFVKGLQLTRNNNFTVISNFHKLNMSCKDHT